MGKRVITEKELKQEWKDFGRKEEQAWRDLRQKAESLKHKISSLSST